MHAQPYSAPSPGVQIAERGGQWEASEIVHQENRGGNKGGGGGWVVARARERL